MENIKYYDLNEITSCIHHRTTDAIEFWAGNMKIATIKLNTPFIGEHQAMRLTSEGWSYTTPYELETLRDAYLRLPH